MERERDNRDTWNRHMKDVSIQDKIIGTCNICIIDLICMIDLIGNGCKM